MSANATEVTAATATVPPVPKRITNAQTVCNERNEKNKLCNGHLKQLKTAGEASDVHLRGDDVMFKCHICGTLYMGPPLGHVRDPEKQSRFVEAELAAVLQAAGGTLPVIKKNEKGVYVIVEPEGAAGHAASAAKPAAKPAAPSAVAAKPSAPATQATAVADKAMAPAGAKPLGDPDRSLNRRSTYAGVVDTGPVAGETKEQKIERLAKVVAGVKQRTEEGGGLEHAATVAVVDSSAEADAHRPAAEAQAETGAASAAPLSKAAAGASPVAGAESAAELAPDSVTPKTEPTSTSHAPLGSPDRALMNRSTYSGFTDSGPVAGETMEQKIARLTNLVEAVKKRTEEAG
jgi:hypothetical protein